jgi:uncharacterized glyoxalase superfamily protein PhnB
MPEFLHFVPVLRVRDIAETIDFYRRHFGFSLAWRKPHDGGGENAMMSAGRISLLFSTGSHLGDSPQFSGSLYIATRGVDALYEAVKDHLEIVWPLEDMDYGQREFGVRDCNGYILAFAEEEAVKPADAPDA